MFTCTQLHRVKFGCAPVLLTLLGALAIAFRAGRKSRLLRMLVLAFPTRRLGVRRGFPCMTRRYTLSREAVGAATGRACLASGLT